MQCKFQRFSSQKHALKSTKFDVAKFNSKTPTEFKQGQIVYYLR